MSLWTIHTYVMWFALFIHSDPQTQSIRLIGGQTASAGRLEVYHSSVWGTVCGIGWTQTDSDVICRQLGYARALTSNGISGYGTGQVGFQYVGSALVLCYSCNQIPTQIHLQLRKKSESLFSYKLC